MFDNVAYGLKLRKMDKKEIHDKVMEILNLVELSGMEGRMTNQLSADSSSVLLWQGRW